MGCLGIGLAIWSVGGIEAAPVLPMLAGAPTVAGSGVEGTDLVADGSDTWTFDGAPATVVAREYRLRVNGVVRTGPQTDPALTVPGGTSGQPYGYEMRVTVSEDGGAISAWESVACGTVQDALELNLTVDGEAGLDHASGTITVTVTNPTAYSGAYTFDAADLATGPVNLVPPKIVDDGTPADGKELTSTPGLWVYDPDIGGLGTHFYQWQTDAGGDGNFADISGATSSAYTLTADEAGDDVRVQETLADNGGARTASSALISVEGAATDPEAGLTLWTSATVAPGDTPFQASFVSRTQSAVFACDITGLDGSGGGIIAELGASSGGMYVGFRTDGTFILRCGEGGDPSGGWPTNTAYIEESANPPGGDGTLVWEIDAATGGVRAWWNGVAIGAPAGNWLGNGNWSGSDKGAYLATSTSLPEGELGTSVAPHSTASNLRQYENQTSNL